LCCTAPGATLFTGVPVVFALTNRVHFHYASRKSLNCYIKKMATGDTNVELADIFDFLGDI